jgi:DnaK suppressor protein
MPTKKSSAKSTKSARPAKVVKPVKATAARKPAAKPVPKATSHAAAKPASKAPARAPAAKPAPATKPVPAAKPAAARPVEAPKPVQSAPAPTPAPQKKPARPAGAPVEAIAVATATRAPRPVTDAGAEAEDGDADSSLLSGPRNVTPYIAKRGEQYMSKEQLDHFRHILGSWKADLMREVDRTVSHMKDEAANFPDPNDRATQEEEFSLELRTRDRERKLIRKIDEALQRIEDGSYGYCLETGEEIGIKRLEARPVATLSLEAQERRERREKQYGDRDDRYR